MLDNLWLKAKGLDHLSYIRQDATLQNQSADGSRHCPVRSLEAGICMALHKRVAASPNLIAITWQSPCKV